ncbi:thiamine pyrophosphate protein [Marinicauda pacifica]|uniref:Thiamine pyrophosphate-binding protein n=1 Tax=Marinicauda pacifica TaxID=1133559 RepID=A0A4S2HDL2_9PROT|nr:thiamine pyrophosphate-binding protein [Marinicauda pacifica]TGY94137.1 thiamine pyrophosphate-binding protein [Marinicauda pacifica]GGE33179.1 thiamine pyrophosphate protein [Marinicauda pacifica]
MIERSGAQHLVDALVAQGTDLAFGVPGESYLAVLDALVDAGDRIRFITCRHEAGAANMAEAYGKMTGRPGICMVTRGPGATHAAIGVHTAMQDSTPMILLIGQVARNMREREAFQEIEYRRFFADQCKWVAEIDDPARVPEFMARAYATAMNGRPGPVVLALPEDMLVETAEAAPVPRVEPARAAPSKDAIAEIKARLEVAERPFLLLGGGGWDAAAVNDARLFAERNGLPVGCTFRAKDYYDNTRPNYAGDVGIAPNPKLAARVRDSDLVIALGPRLGEMTTSGYTLFEAPVPRQSLIHIHPGAEELGRVFQPALAVNASIGEAARMLKSIRVENPAWAGQAEAAHAEFEAFSTPVEVERGVNLSKVFAELSGLVKKDAIVTNGAGNYAAWLHRFFKHRSYRTQLAPTSGAMGYGVPAGVAAKIMAPEREVISVNGDGCFLMCGQELATAMHYGANVIFIVVDNGAYGTIRMHQEREYPNRVSGTDLTNPDFKKFAESFGLYATMIEHEDEFGAAFKRARRAKRPAMIVIRGDIETIAPGRTLSQVRGTA